MRRVVTGREVSFSVSSTIVWRGSILLLNSHTPRVLARARAVAYISAYNNIEFPQPTQSYFFFICVLTLLPGEFIQQEVK